MRNFAFLSFIAAMLIAGPVMAAETPKADAKPAAAAAGEAPKGELWSKRCQDLKDAKTKAVTGKYCEVFQRLAYQSKDGKTTQRVVEFAVGYPPNEKQASAVIVLPVGVMVQDKMSLLIDDKDENYFHVQYCLADGCYATLSLPDSLLGKLGKGKKMMIKSKMMNGQDLHIIQDLTGFDKAVTALKP